jgi:hypothetical protein
MSTSYFDLTMESVARLLNLLPCGVCGLHGPHRAFVTVEGGSSAVCARCAEAGESGGDDLVDVLHAAAPVEVVA